MKKYLYIVTILLSLLILGCAPKKEVSNMEVPTDTTGVSDSSSIKGIDSGSTSTQYENVDLYGSNSNNTYTENDDYGDISSNIQNIYFDVDQYIITPDKLPIIINNAKILNKAVQKGAKIKIEGHCDATGTDEYNYALGLKRAKAVKEALISRGIDPSAIIIVSMGESSPACTTDYSSACFAKNRRVEFKIIR